MSEMTPAALDRWLAEHVMGYTPEDQFVGICEWKQCRSFHPTANIAQAIECAEKARADGRIVDWSVHFDWAFIYPTNLLAIVEKCAQGEIRALSLCRALHAALS